MAISIWYFSFPVFILVISCTHLEIPMQPSMTHNVFGVCDGGLSAQMLIRRYKLSVTTKLSTENKTLPIANVRF
jgi:hypothetical protein